MSAVDRIVEQVLAGLHLEVRTFDETDFADELRGVDIPEPEEACIEKERALVLLDVLDELDSCSRSVLARLYGLGGGEPLTHAQVGAIFGMAPSIVSRIEDQALEQLRPLLSEIC